MFKAGAATRPQRSWAKLRIVGHCYEGGVGMERSSGRSTMDINARQEQFADAFLLAVAAVAGFTAAKPAVDHDSVDWTISSRLPRRPKIDIQMKSRRVENTDTGNVIHYDLNHKNYEDLILADLQAPRLLVLVLVPHDLGDWLKLSPEQLTLQRCAYWYSLANQSERDNKTTVRVHIPRSNLLDVASLGALMQRANDQEPL
jgi:hypothetical protein